MLADPKDISELKIYKNNTYAGILSRSNQGCVFQLDSGFLAQSHTPYFSYRIKNESTPLITVGDNLHPFFAGLLPEGRRFNALMSQLKTSQDDLFSLFALVGSDCVGDINTDGNNAPTANLSQLNEVNFYQLFERSIDSNDSIAKTQAIAGVQEKISASMISFPLNIEKKKNTYILKLNPIDKQNLIYNELQCLTLAKKCGFNVSNAKLIRDKDQNVGLLVTRFDRIQNKKLHQEDACQFLNRYPADKYRVSMNEIAHAIVDITHAPQIEILNLLCQYVFSYLICNGDMHGKNISLQSLEDGTITLTPLYDLICTAIYGDFKMALKIDGRDDKIKRKTIVDFAGRFNINPKAMNSALDKLLQRFTNHYKILFDIDMEERKRTLLHTMIEKRVADLG